MGCTDGAWEIQRGEPFTLPLWVGMASTTDPLVATPSALLKPTPKFGKVPGPGTPSVATFVVGPFVATPPTLPPAVPNPNLGYWLLSLGPEITYSLAVGYYVMDVVISLGGEIAQISDPLWLTVLESVSVEGAQ